VCAFSLFVCSVIFFFCFFCVFLFSCERICSLVYCGSHAFPPPSLLLCLFPDEFGISATPSPNLLGVTLITFTWGSARPLFFAGAACPSFFETPPPQAPLRQFRHPPNFGVASASVFVRRDDFPFLTSGVFFFFLCGCCLYALGGGRGLYFLRFLSLDMADSLDELFLAPSRPPLPDAFVFS